MLFAPSPSDMCITSSFNRRFSPYQVSVRFSLYYYAHVSSVMMFIDSELSPVRIRNRSFQCRANEVVNLMQSGGVVRLDNDGAS
jgi:hypothetical protein